VPLGGDASLSVGAVVAIIVVVVGMWIAHATQFGRTSITLRAEVRNKITRKSILTVEKMVFVNLNEQGEPAPHGRTQIRYADELFEAYRRDQGAVEAPNMSGDDLFEEVAEEAAH